MDGLLVIDKPVGPTSHDVVARMRRMLGERRIGHTGTLDPMATGVLPLVVGRATRLAQFISAADKSYRAVVRLGARTDSGDAEGAAIGAPWTGPLPEAQTIEAALEGFRGEFLQRPPRFSAKKIAGRRSYALARSARAVRGLTPGSDPWVRPPGQTPGSDPETLEMPELVRVRVSRLVVVERHEDRLTLDVDCSAGFYLRALADDLGERLGTGAHLVELRRLRHGELGLDDAISLLDAERDPAAAAARIVPLRQLLTSVEAVTLTAEGMKSAAHGQDLTPAGWTRPLPSLISAAPLIRLLSPAGDLVGLARPSDAAGVLHPFVVLM